MVSRNPVFHNQSRNPQRPVEEQMMITLERLGCFGNGAFVGILANFFCVAEGTVELYTNRCLMAIIALQEQLINWPDAESHQDLQEEFKDVGFDRCVGVIDGTLIILQDCPKPDGPDYYNCKGSYGISTLLVCDNKKMIQFFYTSWPGCSHDQRLTTNCALTKSSHDFFSNGQYILADCAFTPTNNIVPEFKRKKNKPLTDDEHDFNHHLSGVQVVIENCIGLLKNRFQSLKGLRLRLSCDRDVERITCWIMVCLHIF
jgi:hypothetical protein